jgi:glycosyltransferase involved in cell wall biosynthesis
MTPAPRISLAIPLYNEEEVFPELLQRLTAVLDSIPGGPHEIVFVDDGSLDNTFDKVAAAAVEDTRVVGVSLSRNFGHQAALSAALDRVSGDVVIVMDGDLQDPPEVIPLFLEEHRRGFDVVYAQRARRKEGWMLRASYYFFYRMIAVLSNVRLPLDSGDFALLSRRVVDGVVAIPERHRYLRGLRAWVGFRQIGVPVERSQRAAGRSQYTFGKLLRLAFDGIFAFSMAPLRAAAVLGALVVGAAVLFAAYAVYVKVALGRSPVGFTALILVITFFSGVQLLFLGIIGEYLGRVYEETKGRPRYIVGRTVGRARDGS